jgi:hypothetical protein
MVSHQKDKVTPLLQRYGSLGSSEEIFIQLKAKVNGLALAGHQLRDDRGRSYEVLELEKESTEVRIEHTFPMTNGTKEKNRHTVGKRKRWRMIGTHTCEARAISGHPHMHPLSQLTTNEPTATDPCDCLFIH